MNGFYDINSSTISISKGMGKCYLSVTCYFEFKKPVALNLFILEKDSINFSSKIQSILFHLSQDVNFSVTPISFESHYNKSECFTYILVRFSPDTNLVKKLVELPISAISLYAENIGILKYNIQEKPAIELNIFFEKLLPILLKPETIPDFLELSVSVDNILKRKLKLF